MWPIDFKRVLFPRSRTSYLDLAKDHSAVFSDRPEMKSHYGLITLYLLNMQSEYGNLGELKKMYPKIFTATDLDDCSLVLAIYRKHIITAVLALGLLLSWK